MAIELFYESWDSYTRYALAACPAMKNTFFFAQILLPDLGDLTLMPPTGTDSRPWLSCRHAERLDDWGYPLYLEKT
jgi:hypothetical protein